MKPEELKRAKREFDAKAKAVAEKVIEVMKKLPIAEANVVRLEGELVELEEQRKALSVSALVDKKPEDKIKLEELGDKTVKLQLELSDWKAAKDNLNKELTELRAEQEHLEGEAISLELHARRQERFQRGEALREAANAYIELVYDCYPKDLVDYAWLNEHGFRGEMSPPDADLYSRTIQTALNQIIWEQKQRRKEVLRND